MLECCYIYLTINRFLHIKNGARLFHEHMYKLEKHVKNKFKDPF